MTCDINTVMMTTNIGSLNDSQSSEILAVIMQILCHIEPAVIVLSLCQYYDVRVLFTTGNCSLSVCTRPVMTRH